MGKPGECNDSSPAMREPTRGTETSQYLEEEKSKEIPQVEAIERGRAQTVVLAPRGCGVMAGFTRLHVMGSRSGLERPTARGESPVGEPMVMRMAMIPE